VIGFGGEGVHNKPHFHTGKGRINFDIRGLETAVGELVFDVKTMEEPRPRDPMEAINYVIDKYPYRSASQKTIVLLTCTECTGRTIGYYDLQNKLLSAGVVFHVITTTEMELDSVENSNNAFGMNARSVFTPRGLDEDLRSELVEPHDQCTILAQETNGAVFTFNPRKVNNIMNKGPQYMAKNTEKIACQICECQVMKLTARTVCYPCDVPRPVSLTSGRSSGFMNIPFLKIKSEPLENFF
jgi:hypothetical protein